LGFKPLTNAYSRGITMLKYFAPSNPQKNLFCAIQALISCLFYDLADNHGRGGVVATKDLSVALFHISHQTSMVIDVKIFLSTPLSKEIFDHQTFTNGSLAEDSGGQP
jgi:hypothetical protein